MYIVLGLAHTSAGFGGTNEFLPSIVSGEILSSECERLRNFWCTPITVG